MSGVVVHDWLERVGGAEKVMEALADIFPDSPIYCLWDDAEPRPDRYHIRQHPVSRTWLRGRKAALAPVMPFLWRHLPSYEADWVLCCSHSFAHHARFSGPAGNAPKYVYLHTPPRYVWRPEVDARASGRHRQLALPAYRALDKRRAQEISSVVTNSQFIRAHVQEVWGLESRVIYPPVDVPDISVESVLTEQERSTLESLPDGFLLGVSRFIPYKRLDLVLKAGELSGRPVVLAGEGPLADELSARAAHSPGNRVLRRPSDQMLRALYQRAAAFVFPPVEDFGIVPVEAMGNGTPVVGNKLGGCAETVIDGITGALVEDFDCIDEFSSAIDKAVSMSGAACRARAQVFSTDRFIREISDWIAGNGDRSNAPPPQASDKARPTR